MIMEKIYFYKNGEHIFNEGGKYLGWFVAGEFQSKNPPFDIWIEWDQEKHDFLVEELKFEFKEL